VCIARSIPEFLPSGTHVRARVPPALYGRLGRYSVSTPFGDEAASTSADVPPLP
jgi:hypothetical protein